MTDIRDLANYLPDLPKGYRWGLTDDEDMMGFSSHYVLYISGPGKPTLFRKRPTRKVYASDILLRLHSQFDFEWAGNKAQILYYKVFGIK